jgi:transposase
MSLQSTDAKVILEDTLRVAQAAFPRGTPAMTLRDTLGSIFDDPMFAALVARRGQPAASPWRLALVTVLQFAENLLERAGIEGTISQGVCVAGLPPAGALPLQAARYAVPSSHGLHP